MKINPNAPARPGLDSLDNFIGMTIRAEIASRIMAGLAADSDTIAAYTTEGMAAMAVSHADALIAELNKEPQA